MIAHANNTRQATHLPLQGFAHPPSHVQEIGVKPGMHVADFGSGSGAHALALAEATDTHGRVYAIDVQRDLLVRLKNEAKRRGIDHVDILWGDLEMPGGSKLAAAHVDLVLLSNILFQLSDKVAALKEARRILKNKGTTAVIERTGESGLHASNIVSKREVLEFARRADLEPIREFDAGSHHFGIVFRPLVSISDWV